MFRLVRQVTRLTGIPGLGLVSPWRWMRRIAIGVVFLYFAGNAAEVLADSQTVSSARADAIVVLGAAQYNGKPSPALRQRLDHALVLYRAKRAPLIVVTGGRREGDRISEASAGANYLLARGVPDARIKREVQGRDTYESIAATARFLRKRDVRTVLLVSDGYHSARVAAIANEVGLVAKISPSSDHVSFSRLAKETAAMSVGRAIGFRRSSRLFSA